MTIIFILEGMYEQFFKNPEFRVYEQGYVLFFRNIKNITTYKTLVQATPICPTRLLKKGPKRTFEEMIVYYLYTIKRILCGLFVYFIDIQVLGQDSSQRRHLMCDKRSQRLCVLLACINFILAFHCCLIITGCLKLLLFFCSHYLFVCSYLLLLSLSLYF